MRHRIPKLALFAIAVLCAEVPATAAIPAFARRYQTACQTCHVMIPKLNSFGEAVRRNGYRVPEWDETLIKDEPLSLGAEPWKELWPNAMWPSSLPGMPPIAIRGMVNYTNTTDDSGLNNAESSFAVPGIHLLAGGRMGQKFGWFLNEMLHPGQSHMLMQAHVIWNDVMGQVVPEFAMNLRAGAFQPRYFESYDRTTRLASSEPMWGNFHLMHWMLMGVVMAPNMFRLQNPQLGLELNGIINRRWYYALGLVNGDGTMGMTQHAGHTHKHAIDVNDHKDVYFNLKYKLGGRDMLGAFPDEEVSMDTKPTAGWVDNSLLIEAFAYRGVWPATAPLTGEDEFEYYGLSLRQTYEDLDFAVGYVHGDHDDPWAAAKKTEVDTWFAKAEYMFYPWFMFKAVYETMDWEEPPGTMTGMGYLGSLDATRVVVGPVFAPRANMSVIVEAVHYLEHEAADHNNLDDPNSFAVHWNWAF